ncbi:hypothetical protein C8Q74DRAFT_301245 [Fomes fomentarius]|nr:hypothetical protein C8Q74DRAFT_301245 [Fomes fomentarius]
MHRKRDLVAEHLRILLYASPGFTQIITTCPSEPLLAEAARNVFCRRWNGGEPVVSISQLSGPISALSYHLNRSHLDVGTRGEVLAAVLLLDARDRATTYPIPPGFQCSQYGADTLKYDGADKQRIVTLPLFLKALIGASYSETCLKSLPVEYRSDVDAYTSLETAFKDYHIYFNHFIKARDFGVVNRRFIRLAISRGAAIICADNQAAIDIVIPCLRGTELLEENVSAILVQVKNSRTFAGEIKPSVFAAMDPFDCDVFDSQPLPIVRMVFALASKQSVAKVRPASTRTSDRAPSATFTAYDIWCAGVTAQTFGVIQNQFEEMDAQILVQSMRNQGDAEQKYTNAGLKSAVQAMQPLVSTEREYWSSWAEL